MAALALLTMTLAGCEQDELITGAQDKISESVSGAVAKTKQQVSDELKKMFVSEVREFMASGDWAAALGISSEEQESISASVENYLADYELDEDRFEAVKESVEELLENAKGLSAEEIQQSIAGIFESSN